jgi:hypothetical protein
MFHNSFQYRFVSAATVAGYHMLFAILRCVIALAVESRRLDRCPTESVTAEAGILHQIVKTERIGVKM